jgi:hypothetical protein
LRSCEQFPIDVRDKGFPIIFFFFAGRKLSHRPTTSVTSEVLLTIFFALPEFC